MTAELFLEVYAAFENGELPSVKNVEDMLRSYVRLLSGYDGTEDCGSD